MRERQGKRDRKGVGKKERMEGEEGYRRREEERKEEEEGEEGQNRRREGRRAAVMAHEVHNEDELTEGSERQMQVERHMVSAKAGDGGFAIFSPFVHVQHRQSPSAFTLDRATARQATGTYLLQWELCCPGSI